MISLLWLLTVILVVLWVLGFAVNIGAWINLLLVLAVILLLEGTVRDVAVGRLDRKHQAEAVQRGRAGSSRGAAFDNS